MSVHLKLWFFLGKTLAATLSGLVPLNGNMCGSSSLSLLLESTLSLRLPWPLSCSVHTECSLCGGLDHGLLLRRCLCEHAARSQLWISTLYNLILERPHGITLADCMCELPWLRTGRTGSIQVSCCAARFCLPLISATEGLGEGAVNMSGVQRCGDTLLHTNYELHLRPAAHLTGGRGRCSESFIAFNDVLHIMILIHFPIPLGKYANIQLLFNF